MKNIIISTIIAGALIVGSVMFSYSYTNSSASITKAADNVSISGDEQFITINTKGSRFLPEITIAQANMKTALTVITDGTFGCKATLVIPAINYRNNLPPFGETAIQIPPQQAGAVIYGVCGMGAHNFSIDFN